MGKGGNLNTTDSKKQEQDQELKLIKWHEIRQNKWIVIDNIVYDVSNFSRKHPGGERLMLNHIGQDATVKLTKLI